MRINKLFLTLTIIGAALTFSLWPIQSGLKPVVNCPYEADCPNPSELTPRLFYLAQGKPWHSDGGFTSRAEYCQLAVRCTNYHVDIPLSIIVGSGIGAGLHFMFTKIQKKRWSQ